MPPRNFLDTNVWFSAFYSPDNYQKLIRAHINGEIIAIISSEVLAELAGNIKKKLPQAIPLMETMFINSPPELVADPAVPREKIRKYVHWKDWPILSAAIDAQVPYFVTGNTKDFNIPKLESLIGLKILTPKQAVNYLFSDDINLL